MTAPARRAHYTWQQSHPTKLGGPGRPINSWLTVSSAQVKGSHLWQAKATEQQLHTRLMRLDRFLIVNV